MQLLEREEQRAAFLAALSRARAGVGGIVLVSGEAGVGKTALITELTQSYPARLQVLWGSCDPLITPRPLGPLYEIGLKKYPHLLDLLSSGATWLTVSVALYKSLLEQQSESIVVIEDLHWADEATLDLLKYIGRRIDQTRALLVLTYREEEVGSAAPLWALLGSFPAEHTVRLRLRPFTQQTVAQLASQAGRPAEEVYRVTQGNPFFVTEILRSTEEAVPQTVRDAVLGRLALVTPEVRSFLETLSLIPGPVPAWLLEKLLPPEGTALDGRAEGGFLVLTPGVAAFRHELTRLAISESIAYPRTRRYHQRILRALLERPQTVSLAWMLHHASEAEDEELVAQVAPRAAQEASRHGAHREAVHSYRLALQQRQRLPVEEQARLLDALSFEYYLTGQIDDAFDVRAEALAAWRTANQPERVGDDLRGLSRLSWFRGDNARANQYAQEAVQVLEALPPGQALAMAYSNRSQLHMLSGHTAEAIEWGEQALRLAEQFHQDGIAVHALTNIGTAELMAGDVRGLEKLERALALAKAQELHDDAGRCYANIASNMVTHRDYPAADRILNEGIEYTFDREMEAYHLYLRGWQARSLFEQGRWEAAEAAAAELVRQPTLSPVMALPAVTTLSAIKVRRGSADAGQWLDEAQTLARPTGELQRLGPVAAARAEAAWWRGDRNQMLTELAPIADLARAAGDAWQLGQAFSWLRRAGAPVDWIVLDSGEAVVPPVYQAELRGDWRTAVAEWARIGCPYEQAMALAEGEPAARLEALAIFESMGARPAADALRAALRSAGVRGLPRGPRGQTKTNPEGLTSREMDVLRLIVQGASNAQIASQLSISPKTVDHHVSTILGKLGAHSRLEAAAIAREKQLVPGTK